MPEPRRPSQDELLQQLLCPENDRPWKLAVGYILGDIISEQRQMEERLRKAERMYLIAVGGLLLLAMFIIPIIAAVIRGWPS